IRCAPISPLFPYTTLFRSSFPCSLFWVFLLPGEPLAVHCNPDGQIEVVHGREVQLARDYIVNDDLVPIELVCRVRPVIFEEGERSEEHTSELQSRENLVCR